MDFPEPSPAYDTDALDAPIDHPSYIAQQARQRSGPQPCSLSQCMDTFLQPERLAESDAWWAAWAGPGVGAGRNQKTGQLHQHHVAYIGRVGACKKNRLIPVFQPSITMHHLAGRYLSV